MRKLIAFAAAAVLFALPAFAAPVYVPSQGGAVGPNVACATQDGATIRCIQPSVTLNDATGAAIGTSGNPLVTSPGTGTTGDVNVKQVNGATVNVGSGAASTGTQRVILSSDSPLPSTASTAALQSAAQTPVTPATATATVGQLQGCQYKSTKPTFTDAQQGSVQCTTRGAGVFSLYAADSPNPIDSGIPSDAFGNSSIGLRTNSLPALFNGSTWDRQFTCANSATVSVTAGSTTQIVGLSGSTVIRVCSIVVSMSAAGSAGVYTGTGTNCGTGTTALIQDMALPTGTPLAVSAPSGGSLVRSSAGGELCVKAVTGNVTGVITYTQF